MRAITYCRHFADGAALDQQRVRTETYAAAMEWSVIRQIEDTGFLDTAWDAPGMWEAIDAMDEGLADVLIVSSLSRLVLKVDRLLILCAQAHTNGWHIAALDQRLDTTTPQGIQSLRILADMAQWQQGLMSEVGRAKATKLLAKRITAEAEGEYMNNFDGGKLVPLTISLKFQEMREEGKGLKEIARWAVLNKIPGANGQPVKWDATMVRKHLFRAAQVGAIAPSDVTSKKAKKHFSKNL
jgi:DNA invertase Pin-like site-specific DNA recombinase